MDLDLILLTCGETNSLTLYHLVLCASGSGLMVLMEVFLVVTMIFILLRQQTELTNRLHCNSHREILMNRLLVMMKPIG